MQIKQSILCICLMLTSLTLWAGDVFQGKEVYSRYCMGCHGEAGEGLMPGLPNFSRGQQLIRTNRELSDTIRDGNGVMPGFNGIITDDEIENVIAYIRTFL